MIQQKQQSHAVVQPQVAVDENQQLAAPVGYHHVVGVCAELQYLLYFSRFPSRDIHRVQK